MCLWCLALSSKGNVIKNLLTVHTRSQSQYNCIAPANNSFFIHRNVDGHVLQTEDCVNGTWFPNNFNGGSTNYSFLTAELAKRREMAEYREETISYEPDITIFNKTK